MGLFHRDMDAPKAGTYVLGVRPVDTMDWETDYWANVIVKVEE